MAPLPVRLVLPPCPAYAASKEAIVGLTRVAAVEWGKYCINVNCIIPTGDSPAWLSTKAVRTPEQLKATMDHYLIKRAELQHWRPDP